METPITRLLNAWRNGDLSARDELVSALYPELRRLAAQQFCRERSDHTLQPTALVNEAWLRLAGSAALAATDRNHLFGIAARLMREILVDHARRRAAVKRDGGQRITLSAIDKVTAQGDVVDLIALDSALNRLALVDSRKARIVELRYFAGLSVEETAQAIGQSPATVKRHWKAARLWLFHALDDGSPAARG